MVVLCWSFFPGLIAGDALVQIFRRAGIAAALMPALLVESAILGLFLAMAHQANLGFGEIRDPDRAVYAVLVGMLAFTMGLQNGSLRRVGGLKDVHTYVTGTLLAAANGCTEYLLWLSARLIHRPFRERIRRILKYTRRHRSMRSALLAAMLWMFYITGALTGAIWLIHAGINVLYVPIAILLLLALIDHFIPVSRQHSAEVHIRE